MKKILITLFLTLAIASVAQAQQTRFYVSDFYLDMIHKEKIESGSVFSFTKGRITFSMGNQEANYRVVTSKFFEKEGVLAYWIIGTRRNGEEFAGTIEIVANNSKDKYPMIIYKEGDQNHYAFNIVDGYIKD